MECGANDLRASGDGRDATGEIRKKLAGPERWRQTVAVDPEP